MYTPCEKLPLVDLSVTKSAINPKRIINRSPQTIAQDKADAESVIMFLNLQTKTFPLKNIEPTEKYMIELNPGKTNENVSTTSDRGKKQDGNRRPHYTHLIETDYNLIFQAACCLPLKIIAASLDGKSTSGKTLYNNYSQTGGGKLVYGFFGKGREMIIDLKRGNSNKAQRLIFQIGQ